MFADKLNVLYTHRCILRPMTENDADIVVKWRNLPHIASMSQRTNNGELTLHEHLKWFNSSRDKRVDYIIELATENKTPIGSISFVPLNIKSIGYCGELGKYIGEVDALNKGYATEATKRWLKYGFDDLCFDCVFAKTHVSNRANQRVNQKLGFKFDDFPEELMVTTNTNDWLFMRITRMDFMNLSGIK